MVRVVRGTAALRAEGRDELARHALVEAAQSESADGPSVVQVG